MRCPPFTPFQVALRPRAAHIRAHRLPNSPKWVGIRPFEQLQALHSDSSQLATVHDGRARLSKVWAPSGGIAPSENEDSHSMLIRAGFLRQAHSGLFHMLPLGQRVQKKLEALIDKHMSWLGASKLDLSSISSEALWERSGRLKSVGSELFRFRDRKEADYLLSPTHEEEITSLVSSTITSYKDVPVRLYQISRKYRDELRPRHGLLRSREFIMKDLYTFDLSTRTALSTYDEVREAYARLFNELKIPYMVAEADSGDMGGNLSHEFHFPTAKGEDHIISCASCDYVSNEELAEGPVLRSDSKSTDAPKGPLTEVENMSDEDRKTITQLSSWHGISKDKSTLFNIRYSPSNLRASNPSSGTPIERQVNIHALKAAFPEIDNSIEDPLSLWAKLASKTPSAEDPAPHPRKILNIVDGSVADTLRKKLKFADGMVLIQKDLLSSPDNTHQIHTVVRHPKTGTPLSLLRVQEGDRCPRCSEGHLKVQEAIELGHTFHLGSRYTKQLDGHVTIPDEIIKDHETDFERSTKAKTSSSDSQVLVQMGCHGIGVSRMIGAVVDTLADDKGLNWPRVMAPFEAVIVANKGLDDAAVEVYDTISKVQQPSEESAIDLVLDDRTKMLPWKLNDADLIGYPVIVVVGRRWKTEKKCEVQCRRLKIKEDVPLEELPTFIRSVLKSL